VLASLNARKHVQGKEGCVGVREGKNTLKQKKVNVADCVRVLCVCMCVCACVFCIVMYVFCVVCVCVCMCVTLLVMRRFVQAHMTRGGQNRIYMYTYTV
jgi:Flp pilus assembly protein TadB